MEYKEIKYREYSDMSESLIFFNEVEKRAINVIVGDYFKLEKISHFDAYAYYNDNTLIEITVAKDEWYCVFINNYKKADLRIYLCDQLYGLKECVKDKILPIIK